MLLRIAVTVTLMMLTGYGCGGDSQSVSLGTETPAAAWMARISDQASISQFGIPGTHDTCTYTQYDSMAMGYVKTQSFSLPEQLNKGIRFLDIRCRLIGNGFAIHHGPYFLDLSFQDVIDMCKKFLQEHPTETILMAVGHEESIFGDVVSGVDISSPSLNPCFFSTTPPLKLSR